MPSIFRFNKHLHQLQTMYTTPVAISTIVLSLLMIARVTASAQGGTPWTEKQLKDPVSLAKSLRDPSAEKPVIFNVGPAEQIKGAVQVGPAGKKDSLEALRRALAKVSKDKEVVVYCGCCPFSRCPNVRPAFELLKELKFKKPMLLDLPVNL